MLCYAIIKVAPARGLAKRLHVQREEQAQAKRDARARRRRERDEAGATQREHPDTARWLDWT